MIKLALLLALAELAACDTNTLLPPAVCGVTSLPAAQGSGFCAYPSP